MREFYSGVAPRELILQDLRILHSHDRLDTTEKVQELIFIQSVEGRSHNGSGVFTKRTYVNTTIDDIVRALDYDPEGVKKERQAYIDDIVHFVESTLSNQKRDRLVNLSGEPFLGIPFFRDRKVNARDVLRGLYLGGLRDNPDIRRDTEERYKIKIGFGKCYTVDVHRMEAMDLDGEILAHEPHEDKIAKYKEEGLIVEQEGPSTDPDAPLRYYYIRHRMGPGQSDDAALIAAGVLYNVDVALGVFLADAIDTLEKYAPVFKDQDQQLAFYIGRAFKDIELKIDDAYEIAYLASIPEVQEEFVPDSSLRYLLSVDSRANHSALMNHIAFVEGRPVSEMPISFKRILSSEFYEYMKRRLMNARRLDRLSLPELSLEQLSRPAADFAHKNYIVVPKDQELSAVIKQFRDSKSEIVIVVDKNQKVIGTLSATDLINLSHNKL